MKSGTPAGIGDENARSRDLRHERRTAAWRKRRLIVNDDGTQCRRLNDAEVEERGYYLFEPWEQLVTLGHAHDVPVYPCLSASRIGYGEGYGIRGAILSRWRGEAAAAWKAGADGLYLFNTAHDPTSPIYSELGSPEALRDVAPHTHAGDGHDEFLTEGNRFVCKL